MSLSGVARVPAPSSKSHTIRALLAAAWADGPSLIENVLDSADARSCIAAIKALGARVEERGGGETGLTLSVAPIPASAGGGAAPPLTIDVGNSGTTLYLLAALTATESRTICFDGDESIRSRSAGPLLEALRELGARVEGGPSAPFCVTGPIRAGREVALESPTSQYLSALLLAAPLAATPNDAPSATSAQSGRAPTTTAVGGGKTVIRLLLLNERPYVDMTCRWLDRLGVSYKRSGYEHFSVAAADRRYPALSSTLPGDYSSASFWFCAAAVTGKAITVDGLDPNDVQGDRAVLSILETLGCSVAWDGNAVTVSGRVRNGGVFDLNAIPDSLPILAVTAAYAESPVELVNVPQARSKETDRIAVIASELGKLGVRTEERPDGLIIYPARPSGGEVSSHGDHRIAMACAVGALGAESPVVIRDADVAAITYPRFFEELEMLFPGAVEVFPGR